MTNLFIQITISIGVFIAGYGLGELIRREVVDEATGARRPRWPWLTTQRVSAVLLVLLAVSGIITTYSIRSCQANYNESFVRALNDRAASTGLLYDSLITLFEEVLDPTNAPEDRAEAIRKAQRQLAEAQQVRTSRPLPPHPQC